ncbi:hypothetical protein EW145_g5233 [Phellinidium pouzarii]|uniref:Pali-domain-containing protein n=1 Tax=Phellinidium pouzarii TaxID=167371 RepID=A0A4S4L5I0_9AGAM|nr:hypothetical protein EW145_g5233 [Phellinidium pouzarii]
MSRAFCIPGIFFLTCALVLLILVSISLPTLTAFDFARVHFNSASNAGDSRAIDQIRFGIWSYCTDSVSSGERTCSSTAAAVTFLAFLFSFSQHVTLTLVSSLLSFLAAILTLIAFLVDIALFAFVKHEMGKLNIGAHTITGPGFWITFVSFILLLLAGCTVCFGRRRARMDGASSSYPMASTGKNTPFWNRFRRRGY